MKTILVTGGSGFIGKNLCLKWAEKYNILAPSHSELDLTVQQSVDSFFAENEIDIIIHCAIKPGHRAALDRAGLLDSDLRMYYNLRQNAVNNDIKMYVIGSGCCYDMAHYIPRMKENYLGQHIPKDETGFAKYITSLDMLSSKNIYDLRVFGIFGPYEDYSIRFISNAICKAIEGLPITLRQDRIFDYIYIDDFITLLDQMINTDLKHHAYNITSDNPVSLLQLAKWVKEISGADIPIQVAQTGLGSEYSGDNGQLREEFPEFKFHAYQENIKKLFDFYNQNRQDIDFDKLIIDK